MSRNPSILVDDPEALVDAVIRICVEGLSAHEPVTVRAEIRHEGAVYAACANYVADDQGVVDVTRDASSGGTYEGVSAMGLFWSMKAAPGQPYGLRLVVANASLPLLSDVAVFPGHLSLEQTYTDDASPLCTKIIRRWYMGKGVKKIPVSSGRLRGTLFLPQGRGPFPGVIDMFGTMGACIEFRAALLASHGFAALALPYFRYRDLPKKMADVEFEYFMEAVDWLCNQDHVDPDGVGVMGVSKGGEIALHLAYYHPKVKAVVSINGAPFFTVEPMKYNGGYIGESITNIDDYEVSDEGVLSRNVMDAEIHHYLPLWKKNVHCLLVNGLDDVCLRPKLQHTFYNLYPPVRRHFCRLLTYTDAGHLIEPPYAPLTRATKRHAGVTDHEQDMFRYIVWGGRTEGHAHAQEDSWRKILEHFRTHLSSNTHKDHSLKQHNASRL
ncbi:acyl-coenzyme A amino acid N-acyltransferase 1-like [Mya arenaria]|uniref:acyl-coenzyme A amino acid N-acyltransferase 1-like n=1 Tax=Mya arenaria TaxID=6604 RepID=UPI0022E8A381|nr:acyl-coenzyme A amino acid N-acyltransferase 1-like [Mya arenaria]